MDSLGEERVYLKNRSQYVLKTMKEVEAKTKFYSRTIGKNTIVYCKNKERLDDFENSYNNIKNW